MTHSARTARAALVAAGIGISERHLSRAFAGTGFPQYVLGRRLDRARTLLEAILWHGGEAQLHRDAVIALPPEDRAALLSFLESL